MTVIYGCRLDSAQGYSFWDVNLSYPGELHRLPSKSPWISTGLHGITSHEIIIFIVIAVKTSNPKWILLVQCQVWWRNL
jgi:hypothetical protein